jgi:hypothetical protein
MDGVTTKAEAEDEILPKHPAKHRTTLATLLPAFLLHCSPSHSTRSHDNSCR